MDIVMTIDGVDCNAKVLDNEIICRLPKNVSITGEGALVEVRRAASGAGGSSFTSFVFIQTLFSVWGIIPGFGQREIVRDWPCGVRQKPLHGRHCAGYTGSAGCGRSFGVHGDETHAEEEER